MKVTYRKVDSGIYQLVEDFTIQVSITQWDVIHNEYITLHSNGVLHLAKGYVSDGPSGPTFDTPNSIRAAFVHDALYRLMRMGLLPEYFRKQADEELLRILLEDGMSSLRAKNWYFWLRVAGGSNAAFSKDANNIYVAP